MGRIELIEQARFRRARRQFHRACRWRCYMTVMPRRHLLSLIFLILIGTLASVLLQNSRPMWRDATGSAVADRIGREDTSPEVIWGKGELTVITFPDYQCPACRRAAPALQSAAKRDGDVRIVYKDSPVFGKRSVRAASIVLEAHEQQLYVPVHEKLTEKEFLDVF